MLRTMYGAVDNVVPADGSSLEAAALSVFNLLMEATVDADAVNLRDLLAALSPKQSAIFEPFASGKFQCRGVVHMVARSKIEARISPTHPYVPEAQFPVGMIDKLTTYLSDGKAVVLRNAPFAAHADLFVLISGAAVICCQCKNYGDPDAINLQAYSRWVLPGQYPIESPGRGCEGLACAAVRCRACQPSAMIPEPGLIPCTMCTVRKTARPIFFG